jgi:peptidoglycan hydrolase CwlO-like protein
MRTKKFDKCNINEMEEDIRNELEDIQNELTEIQAELMELQQDVTECKTDIADNKQKIHNINTRHIPPHIKSKLIVVFSV